MWAQLDSNYPSLGTYSVQDTESSTESSPRPEEVGLSVVALSQMTDGLGGHAGIPRQKCDDS